MMPNKLVSLMASFLILTSVIILMTSQGSSGAKRGGDFPACAACKHRRSRCGPNCFFLPYFPAGRNEDLQNVRRLFGLRPIENTLRPMSSDERDDAMKSIIYESNMRAQFPVYGCCQIIWDLQNRIALLNAELLRMYTQIATSTSAIIGSDPATAAYYPAVTFFNPSAAEFSSWASGNPPMNRTLNNEYTTGVSVVDGTRNFFPDGNFAYNPDVTAAYNPATVDSSSLELRNPPMNRTLNNNNFAGVSVVDGTRNFFPGGGYSGNYAYGEYVTETRPLERTNNAQQFLPTWNNLGSCPANANNYNNELDALDFDAAALLAFDQIGAPNSDNRIPPTNNNQIQLDDHLLTDDAEPSFSQTGDEKCKINDEG